MSTSTPAAPAARPHGARTAACVVAGVVGTWTTGWFVLEALDFTDGGLDLIGYGVGTAALVLLSLAHLALGPPLLALAILALARPAGSAGRWLARVAIICLVVAALLPLVALLDGYEVLGAVQYAFSGDAAVRHAPLAVGAAAVLGLLALSRRVRPRQAPLRAGAPVGAIRPPHGTVAAPGPPPLVRYGVVVDGQVHGPYSVPELRAFVSDGRLGPATPVHPSDAPPGVIVPAHQVPGLFS